VIESRIKETIRPLGIGRMIINAVNKGNWSFYKIATIIVISIFPFGLLFLAFYFGMCEIIKRKKCNIQHERLT